RTRRRLDRQACPTCEVGRLRRPVRRPGRNSLEDRVGLLRAGRRQGRDEGRVLGVDPRLNRRLADPASRPPTARSNPQKVMKMTRYMLLYTGPATSPAASHDAWPGW